MRPLSFSTSKEEKGEEIHTAETLSVERREILEKGPGYQVIQEPCIYRYYVHTVNAESCSNGVACSSDCLQEGYICRSKRFTTIGSPNI